MPFCSCQAACKGVHHKVCGQAAAVHDVFSLAVLLAGSALYGLFCLFALQDCYSDLLLCKHCIC